MADLITTIENALGILSGAADVVGIFDSQSLGQLFINARPLKAGVRPTSQLMNRPAETGVLLSDHKIINQVEIELPLMISQDYYGAVYQQIKTAFRDSTLLIVQTRTDVYPNMVIQDMPHAETPDIYDSVVVTLKLKEVLFAPAPSTYDPVDETNSDTVQSGQQQGISPGPTPTNPTQYHGATGAW